MINFSMERAQEGLQQSLIICLDASALNQREFKEGGILLDEINGILLVREPTVGSEMEKTNCCPANLIEKLQIVSRRPLASTRRRLLFPFAQKHRSS